MDQAAEQVPAVWLRIGWRSEWGRVSVCLLGGMECECPMWPMLVVMAGIDAKHVLELPSAEDAEAVEAHQRLVDRDPVEPGEELGVAAITVQVAPRLHEDVLGRLLDVAAVIEEPVEHRRDPSLARAHELAEGLDVPGRCTVNELTFTPRHGRDRTM
jgi:hypothetical protein